MKTHVRDVRGWCLMHAMHVSDVGAMEVSLGVGECTTHCVRIKSLHVLDIPTNAAHFWMRVSACTTHCVRIEKSLHMLDML